MLKKICLVFSLATSLVLTSLAVGQNAIPAPDNNTVPSDAYDCTIVALDSVDEASLTTAERIAQMDANLLDSIDKHDNCIDQVVSSNAASGSGEGDGLAGEGGGNVGSEGAKEDDTAEDSSGDSSEGDAKQANHPNATNKQPNNESQTSTQVSGDGAKNQDIATKDNDSAVCRLLKDELKIETDLKKQADLKEIYNSYQCRG